MRIDRRHTRFSLLAAALILLAGCTTYPSRGTPPPTEPLDKAALELSEDQLLDVSIERFEPGSLPEDEERARGLSPEIRDAESRYLPLQLRDTLESTGYWGAVRVLPMASPGAELLVQGRILASDGESLQLQIQASDATGRQWFDRQYDAWIDLARYQGTAEGDAFYALYNAIANDLASFRAALSAEQLLEIRRVAELRFAADMAPDVFEPYLQATPEGGYRPRRLPAEDDPMYLRIQTIRARDALLVDTLNGHFDNYYLEMQQPYDDWRRSRLEEIDNVRELESQANQRKLLGAAAIVGAIALGAMGGSDTQISTSTLRDVMVLGGAYAIKTGFDKDSETEIHREAIEELGDSFRSESQPLVVEVDGEVHELSGSAEAQYGQWRQLLQAIYATETGAGDYLD